MEADNPVGHLVHGAHALFRFHSRVGGLAVEGDVNPAKAFPFVHQVSVGPGGLQDHRRAAFAGQFFDPGAGPAGTDLLLAVVDDAEGAGGSCLRESPGGVKAEEKPPLHVVHAGAVGPVFIPGKGPLRHGSLREDRVEVPQEQGIVGGFAVGYFETGTHRGAEILLLHLPADAGEGFFKERGHLGHAFGVFGLAVDVHQVLEVFQKLVEVERNLHWTVSSFGQIKSSRLTAMIIMPTMSP